MFKTKTAAALLCLAIVLSLLASCAESVLPQPTVVNPSSETPTPTPTQPSIETTETTPEPPYGEAVNWCSHEHTSAASDKAATCVCDGYKNRLKCSDCGAMLEYTGSIIPAYGHEYNARKCIHCSKNKPSLSASGQFEGGKVIWQLFDDGELAVSGRGEVPSFPENENSYFLGFAKAVKSIVIYRGVTAIGDNAFRGLRDAVTVNISSSVRRIGDHAFDGWSVKTLNLSYGLTTVGKDNFTGNQLFFLELPSSLTSVGAGSFSSAQMVTLRIPASVKTYEAHENQYSNLRNVAFMGDESSARALSLYSHLTEDGGCANVQMHFKFTSKASSLPYCSKRGQTSGDFTYCIFTDDSAMITGYKGSAQEIVIPETVGGHPVTAVEHETFKNNKTVKKVTLPSTCTALNYKAFVDCSSLEELTVLADELTVGANAFSGCSSLKTLNFEGVFKDIGAAAFSSTHIENFPLSPDMKIARVSAFASSSIKNVDFSQFDTICDSAFARTSIPEDIDLSGVSEIGAGAFYACSLSTVNVTNVKHIAHAAFAGNGKLTREDVMGLETVETIEDGAFPFDV